MLVASADDHEQSMMTLQQRNKGPSLILVEERRRSCCYEGGQVRQVEARTCGDAPGTTLQAHHTGLIQPVYGRHLMA